MAAVEERSQLDPPSVPHAVPQSPSQHGVRRTRTGTQSVSVRETRASKLRREKMTKTEASDPGPSVATGTKPRPRKHTVTSKGARRIASHDDLHTAQEKEYHASASIRKSGSLEKRKPGPKRSSRPRSQVARTNDSQTPADIPLSRHTSLDPLFEDHALAPGPKRPVSAPPETPELPETALPADISLDAYAKLRTSNLPMVPIEFGYFIRKVLTRTFWTSSPLLFSEELIKAGIPSIAECDAVRDGSLCPPVFLLLERDEQITILFEAYSLTLKIADKIKLRKLLQYHGIVYYRDMYDMWLVQQGVAFTLQYLRWKKTLGKGSFGQVHLLQNYLNEHLCAMKVIKVQPDDSDSLVNLEDDKYLLGEIETLQRITSPYVAAMIPNNALVCGSIAFFIMEFYSGGSLRDKLDRIHPASLWQHSPEQTATVMRQLLEGIATIHDARALHRDLKPENILFDNQDTLKISDFGLAKAYKSKVTHGGGTIVGTAGYMAPEISQGMLSTPACDIWSAGVILYELSTTQLPDNTIDITQSAFWHLVPQNHWISSFLVQMLNLLPRNRPTARALLEQLDEREQSTKLASSVV